MAQPNNSVQVVLSAAGNDLANLDTKKVAELMSVGAPTNLTTFAGTQHTVSADNLAQIILGPIERKLKASMIAARDELVKLEERVVQARARVLKLLENSAEEAIDPKKFLQAAKALANQSDYTMDSKSHVSISLPHNKQLFVNNELAFEGEVATVTVNAEFTPKKSKAGDRYRETATIKKTYSLNWRELNDELKLSEDEAVKSLQTAETEFAKKQEEVQKLQRTLGRIPDIRDKTVEQIMVQNINEDDTAKALLKTLAGSIAEEFAEFRDLSDKLGG